MDIKKKDDQFAMMVANMIKRSIPKPAPEINYNQGIVGGFFGVMKMEQLMRASECARKISEDNYRSLEAAIKSASALANLKNDQSERDKMYAQTDFLRDIERQERTENLKQSRIKTQVMFYSSEQERIAAEIAKRNSEMMFKEDDNDHD